MMYGYTLLVFEDERVLIEEMNETKWLKFVYLSGLVMMPSVIYAYIQVGHFLMLIMSTSWVYSTFFFLALCAISGPQGHVGDILKCWTEPPCKRISSPVVPVKPSNATGHQVISVKPGEQIT